MKDNQEAINQLLGFFTFKCPVCGADTFDDEIFCSFCAKDIHKNDGKTCAKCGTPIYGVADYCSKCGKADRFFDKAVSVYRFEGNLRKVFYRFKFAGFGQLCEIFAKELANKLKVEFPQGFDLITFVPMHEQAEKVRGYNQSRLLCSYMCDIINNTPTELLVKIRSTLAQEGLSYQQRIDNVTGAYKVNCLYDKDLKGKRVLIIDDVLTTGATASECAKLLKSKGATQVCILTVASRAETITTQ